MMTTTIKYIQRNRQSGDNRPRRNTSEPIPCRTDALCKGNPPRERPGMKNPTGSKPCPHRRRADARSPAHAMHAPPRQRRRPSDERHARVPLTRRKVHATQPHPHSGRALATLPRSPAHTMHAPPRQRGRGGCPRDKRNAAFPTQAAEGLNQVRRCSWAIGAPVYGSRAQTNIGLRLRTDVFPKDQ
uniref:Uncharacterized protein n=1 Tax=Rangifer tarandus platyrhynchus TaxID=3082113 RepID=A0ACB0EG34_RANTA|nr:unnamed protein product [Rangifer tarandus platyrhynchus]